jgi:hypothetical protein
VGKGTSWCTPYFCQRSMSGHLPPHADERPQTSREFIPCGAVGFRPERGCRTLSRRDYVMVATRLSSPKSRQFIAWYPCKNGNRPVGHGMIGSDRRATIRTTINRGEGSNRTLRDGFSIEHVPGNKLPGLRRAQSSRYHHMVPPGPTCVFMLTRLRGRRKARSTE